MRNSADPTPPSPGSSRELRLAIQTFHALPALGIWQFEEVDKIVKRFISTPQFFPIAIALLNKFPEPLDRVHSYIGKCMRFALTPARIIKLFAICIKYEDPSLIELTCGGILENVRELQPRLDTEPDKVVAEIYNVFQRVSLYTEHWARTPSKLDKFQAILDHSAEPKNDLDLLTIPQGTLCHATAEDLVAYYKRGHRYIHSNYAFPPQGVHEEAKLTELKDSLQVSKAFSMLTCYPSLKIQSKIVPIIAKLPADCRQKLLLLAEKFATAQVSFELYKTLVEAIGQTPALELNGKFLDDMNRTTPEKLLQFVPLYLDLQAQQQKEL